MKHTILKILKYTGISILVLIIGVVVTFKVARYFALKPLIEMDYEDFKAEPFDQKKWLNAAEAYRSRTGRLEEYYPCVMGHMYHDLVTNYLKVGMPMKDVAELISDPPERRIYKTFWGEKKCWQYLLGTCGLPGPTKIMLICPDNQEQKVKEIFYSDENAEGEDEIDYNKWGVKK